MCTWNWTLYFNWAQKFLNLKEIVKIIIINCQNWRTRFKFAPKEFIKKFKIVKARMKGFFEKEKLTITDNYYSIMRSHHLSCSRFWGGNETWNKPKKIVSSLCSFVFKLMELWWLGEWHFETEVEPSISSWQVFG